METVKDTQNDGGVIVEGTVYDIIFQNEDNGYTVCEVDTGGELVTLVGTMPYLLAGEHLKANGEWTNHPNFGRQLKVTYFEKSLPANGEAIYHYLASGAIKGVGPVTAQRIVDKFGEDTFDVLENNPLWLAEIKGITRKTAENIGAAFAAQFGVRNVMMFLGSYFGAAVSVRIYKKYKSAAIDIVKANPYRLCEEIAGVGFEKADNVGKELGFTDECSERLDAGIKYVLNTAAYNGGHCYLPYAMLMSECRRVLNVDAAVIASALAVAVAKGEIVKTHYGEHDGYALLAMHGAEQYIADKLKLLNSAELPYRLDGIDEQIALLEEKQDITYHEKQKKAIRNAVCFGVSIVTGGPGTGKTTVIKAILDIFDIIGISYALAAPTGRAAKRMSEASGREAKTIHRLLEMTYSEEAKPVFSKNADDPLGVKAVVIDEMSMVDTLLMEALLRSLKSETILILIGDVDQLPPVGPGNVLCDMIQSDEFPTTRLEHIFRQASESMIVMNAHRINAGEEPVCNKKDSDFFFIGEDDPNRARTLICDLCRDRLPNRYGIDPFDSIQVITPTRRGDLGTHELNRVLQECLNPRDKRKKEKRVGNVFFRECDKVMQVKNNYDLTWLRDGEDGSGIFNGDIGRILEIRFRDECFVIDFDGRICEYDFALAEELEHAYAVTVHKSQGSEYPFVVIPALRCPAPLMTRNLLYTAVTRAKKMLVTVGSKAVIAKMAANDRKDVRFSGLLYML